MVRYWMSEIEASAANIELLGGRLSLDFANTVDWHASQHPVEFLTSYSELAAWSVHAGILIQEEGEHLRREAAARPVDAEAVLSRAISLREAIYRVFSAISHGLQPEESDLAVFNEELAGLLAKSRLGWLGDGLGWRWAGKECALDRMLWAVVWDAADLLTSGQLDRVGQCADHRCGWLFLDTSRNRSRRWCSMAYCGNRAKAKRHYQRSKTS
jgi:predicted RNA-binding Zn ribbon-like protein